MTTWCRETRARDGHESGHHRCAIAVNWSSTGPWPAGASCCRGGRCALSKCLAGEWPVGSSCRAAVPLLGRFYSQRLAVAYKCECIASSTAVRSRRSACGTVCAFAPAGVCKKRKRGGGGGGEREKKMVRERREQSVTRVRQHWKRNHWRHKASPTHNSELLEPARA